MNRSRIHYILLLLGALLPFGEFAQQHGNVVYFKYCTYLDGEHGKHWVKDKPMNGRPLAVTRFDFSKPDEVDLVYGYGSKTAQHCIFKKVNEPGFNKEPRQIRGHVLQGVYKNTENGLYELYYLAKNKKSLLERLFFGPGNPFTSQVFVEQESYEPFRDTLFPHNTTETINISAPATIKHTARPT
ncbi:MAG TPA: hypothetical protein VF008_20345 [Niastella sp.]